MGNVNNNMDNISLGIDIIETQHQYNYNMELLDRLGIKAGDMDIATMRINQSIYFNDFITLRGLKETGTGQQEYEDTEQRLLKLLERELTELKINIYNKPASLIKLLLEQLKTNI